MKSLNKIILILITVIILISCSGSRPYELKSPCVSDGHYNPWYKIPCIKRPANLKWDIV